MTSHPNNAEHQATKRDREKAAGLVRVTVTIPKERKPELKAIVRSWMEPDGHSE